MGVFSRIKNAKATGGGFQYLEEGDHRLEVREVRFTKTRKGIEMFAAKLRCVTTNNSEQMREGFVYDWCTTGDKDVFEGNVKAFVAALYGYRESDIDSMSDSDFDQLMELVSGPEQAGTGRLIDAECRPATSKAGKEYLRVAFVAVAEDEQPSAVQNAA